MSFSALRHSDSSLPNFTWVSALTKTCGICYTLRLVTLLLSTLLNCFVLKTLCSKTKQLRSVLVKLLVLNGCLNGRGFYSCMTKSMKTQIFQITKFQTAIFVSFWRYLQIAQVLAEADNLVIIVSVWLKTQNLSSWALKQNHKIPAKFYNGIQSSTKVVTSANPQWPHTVRLSHS